MHKHVQLAVSLACLGVIGAGARYAYGREQLRQMDPHTVYMQINRESFSSELPDVPVSWADVGDERYGVTHFYKDGSADIEIDRQTVLSESMLREVVRHEACHVAVRPEIGGEDAHGGKWQKCMGRFK